MREFMSHPALKVVAAFFGVTLAAYGLSSALLLILQSGLGTGDHPPAPLSTAHAKRDLPAKLPVNHYRSIWEKDVFGASGGQEKEPEAVPVEALSLTSLNCSLIGTISDENGEGWAVIRDDDDGRQEMVTLGSNVKGARVVRIFKDKVVLNIDGQDELLVMAPEGRPAQTSPAAASAQRGRVLSYNVSRDLVQESLADLASVMAGVRVEPYFAEGRPDGFRVSRIQPGSLLTTMGLQNGDIIKSVNDRPITTAEDAMRLYGAMKDSPFFRVGIIRNNQPATLQIRVR